MPDSTIVLDPSTQEPQRWWVGNSSWSLTYAPSQIPEAFYNGMPYTVPEPFVPGSSGPVTWSATFTASRPGVTLRWAWSAAVYSRFGVNGWLLVKPLTVPVQAFQNDDRAGTPEVFKQYVVAGAMGTGAPDFTGARSETVSVNACLSPKPPPPTAAVRPAPATQQRFAVRLFSAFSPAAPSFASPVSQHVTLSDGSIAQAVERCYATDLCAMISYVNGGQLSIYSEGAAYCKPYVLHFERTSGGRTIYAFSREVDYDRYYGKSGSRCGRSRTTHIVMDGGRVRLTVSKNVDGTLRFHFEHR